MREEVQVVQARSRYRRVTLPEIRRLLGEPDGMARAKILDHIDQYQHRFIAHSPFAVLATADATGLADCSPRGDYPGFVKVLDQRTLAIPDRPGNKLADSFTNLAENDGVGLLFFIPGMRETLRVNGRGYVTDETDVLVRMRIEAKQPSLAIIVEVAEAYFHCARALIRSRVWDAASQALAEEMPSFGEIVAAQMNLDIPGEAIAKDLEQNSYRSLY